jgi:hypothetical protein
MTWRQRLSRLAIVRAGRSAGQSAHRVAAQGYARAKLTGAKLARRVTAIQKAARLDPRLMRESARSVACRPMERASDRAWQIGYAAEAGRRVPGLVPRAQPAIAPPPGPERPVWPHAGPKDLEAGG